MRLSGTLLLFLIISIGVFAQQPAQSGPLTNQRIIELLHSGVRPEELARIIATAPQVSVDLSPTGTNTMMKAGISEDTIKAMAAREAGFASDTPVQQPPTPSQLSPRAPSSTRPNLQPP